MYRHRNLLEVLFNLMKYILTALLGFIIAISTSVYAAPVSWDFAGTILQPLQSARTALIKGSYFQATSTVATSSFPVASSTTFCLGTDCRTSWPTGGGGGSISTSTTPTPGQLSYWTSTSALGSVATGTLTETVTGLQFDQTRGLVGGSAVLSLSSGFTIPSTTDITGWNLASSSRHSAVTLSGALDYITLVGQDIVRGAIDLATDVTGFLGISNGGTGTSTAPAQDQILVGKTGGTYDYRRITAGSNVTVSTSTPGQIIIGSTAGGGSGATSTTVVCATGCEYSSIQSAINAGRTNIELKAETYNEFVSITASDTRIKGAGMYSSLITCAGSSSTPCVKIATSTALTRITLEDFGIDNTSGVQTGVGLDTSNTSNVYTNRIRITDFDVAHLHQDTNNTSFYSAFYNMVYFDVNTCFQTGGTKSNDNALYSPRCRPEVYGYRFIDSEGWLLSSPNSEPASIVGTGLYIDGTSIGITVLNPWFEGNATGTEIASGALNTSIKGGRITAGTIGVADAGTRTFLDSTLVSANTTDFTAGSTGLTTINGRSTYSAPSILVGTTTPGSTYERLVLGLSTSDSAANALVINNYGAFATAPSAILFNNTTGGFNGTGRIFVNPGSGYTNANMNFAVADSAKALQTRMTIDVDGDVGIASTTPSSKLTVEGNAYLGGNLRLTGAFLDSIAATGTLGMVLQSTGTSTRWVATSTLGITGGSGDVTGPATSTDNAIARFDSTTGKIIQNSSVTVGDTGDVAGVNTLNATDVVISNELQVDNIVPRFGSTVTIFPGLTVSGDATTTGKFTTLNGSSTNQTVSGTTYLTGLTASRSLFLDALNRATTTGTSAFLSSSLSDEAGSGPAVFASSTSLTSPTLFNFFGTPCSAGEFLTDIADNGAFTCTAGGGGGGGGSLSTSTDIIGAPGTVESLSYVSEDFLIGGSSSTTAEFQFDPDGGQLYLASTSNSNATATIESSNSAQAVRLGDDSGVGIEWIFSTASRVLTRVYGSITEWFIDIAKVAMTGKLFVATTTYNGATTTDALVIDGYTNSGEWIQEFCTSPSKETTEIAADTLRFCNSFSALEDAAGVLGFIQPSTATSSYFRLRAGAAGTAAAAGDGIAMGWALGQRSANLHLMLPAMEWTMRQDFAGNYANGSSTLVMAGIANKVSVSVDMATEPGEGFYVISTSTTANYMFACNPASGGTTYINTGIASTTSATAGANPFVHFRLEMQPTSTSTAHSFILKARTWANRTMTDIGSCTISNSGSNTALAPFLGIGKSTAGTSIEVHTHFLKYWYKNFVF